MNKAMNRQWSQQTPGTLPPSRKASSIVYDAKRGVSVLFGGGGLNDTWVWDGKAWTQRQPLTAPPARASACMAFDTANECVMLFGGADTSGNLLNDTWTWDGTTWTQKQPTSSPTPRCGASMAYDAARRRLLLFGGQTYGGRAGTLLNDTWTWDGTTWTQRAVPLSPLARLGASMVYDAGHQSIVLFGGAAGGTLFNDTWVWAGTTWEKRLPPTSPSVRAWASMAYDGVTGQVVLVGGGGGGDGTPPTDLSDTWLWDGISWMSLPTHLAPAGGYHSATYDAARQVVVVYATAGGKPDLGTKKTGSDNSNALLNPSFISQTWLWTTMT